MQLRLEPLISKLIDHKHRLTVILALFLFLCHLALFYLDVIALSQLSDGLYIGALLHLHDKAHSITCLATTKAFEDTLGWRHGEGTRLFMVKRTEPPEVGSLLFEGDITANDIFYFGSLKYPVNGFFWNHFGLGLYIISPRDTYPT